MNGIRFAKYEGLGNTFVLLDYTQHAASSYSLLPLKHRQWLCNPHHGIGADGVLSLFAPTKHPQAAVYIHVTNADGTTAATCGNGLRCVALWLQNQKNQKKTKSNEPFMIATDSGLREVLFTAEGICINMGVAHIDESRRKTIPSRYATGTLVNMGNTHLVMEQPACSQQAVTIGKSLKNDTQHDHGINVGLYELTHPSDMNLCVCEYGAGLTQACGSGACAAVAAAIAAEKLQKNHDITVQQPGGCLTIRQDNQNQMWMTGPAHRVCEGTAWLPRTSENPP